MNTNQPTDDSTNADAFAFEAAAAAAEAVAADHQNNDRLAAVQTERDQYFDNWKRSQAEFDNIRKRMQREFEQAAKYESLAFIRDVLPGLDNLRRALEAANKNGKLEDLTKGVEMTLKQFESILEKHNAKPIAGTGKPFDPNLHEAITQMPSAEHPPMTVLMEVERGYILHDRVVRPSKVIVSTAQN